MRRSKLVSGIAAFVVSFGCTIPTDLPANDVRWIVPLQSTSIAVASYLPAGVLVASDSSGFVVNVAPVSVTRSLAQDCVACAAANGVTVPKPAFIGASGMSTSLPSDVVAATLAGGTLQVVVRNNYNFDPLRPSVALGAATGFAVITVTNGAAVIGKDSVNGATTALAPGAQLTRSIPLSGAVTGSSPMSVSVTINSPAGDPVQIDASGTIVLTATPQNLSVPSANIAVVNKSVSSSSSQDLTGVDSVIINDVQSGNLQLSITNPFGATGNLSLTLAPPTGAPIAKTVVLAAGTTAVSVSFTGPELKRLLGNMVNVTYSGAVNSSGMVSVTPKQVVGVQSHLDLNFEVGTVKP